MIDLVRGTQFNYRSSGFGCKKKTPRGEHWFLPAYAHVAHPDVIFTTGMGGLIVHVEQNTLVPSPIASPPIVIFFATQN